jgi:hypothetical protein
MSRKTTGCEKDIPPPNGISLEQWNQLKKKMKDMSTRDRMDWMEDLEANGLGEVIVKKLRSISYQLKLSEDNYATSDEDKRLLGLIE